MVEGATAFEPTGSARAIDDFREAAKNVYTKVENANQQLFTTLSTIWYSPNAVLFDITYEPKIFAVQESIMTGANTVLKGAIYAYNEYASSNGVSQYTSSGEEDYVVSFNQQNSTYANYTTLEEKDPNGNVFMKKEEISTAVGKLGEEYKLAILELDSFPTTIAMYDPDGSIQSAYSWLIQTTKDKLEQLLSEISTSVQEYMNMTIDEAEAAVAAAQEALTTGESGS